MSICTRCKNPFEDFITKRGKPSKKCPKCLIVKNRQNIERHNRIMREYYSQNKQKYKEMRFRNAIKRKYGLTVEQYQSIWDSQHGKCDICGIHLVRSSEFGKPSKNMPCVDHCHSTGLVRGILCRGCNLKLEIIDNNDFIEKAIQYLGKYKM